ncbi:MAG: hypothetical protein ABIP17_08075 [Ilumatobacteraceae bacterium]
MSSAIRRTEVAPNTVMTIADDPALTRPDHRWAAVRTPLTAVVVVIVSLISPLERMLTSGWISDDTSWQVALRTWRPWDDTWVLTENTYILHWPLFVVANALLPSNRWTVLLIAAALQSIGLWLIVSFARHAVARSIGRPIAGLRWWNDLLALGACGAYQVLDTIARQSNAGVSTRNLEAGLYLLTLRLGFEIVNGERPMRSVQGWLAVMVAVATLSLNDPLFAYTIVVPLIGATVVVWIVGSLVSRPGRAEVSSERWMPAYRLASSAGAGLLLWRLVHALLPTVGITQRAASTRRADLGVVPEQARIVLGGLAQMAGRALTRDSAFVVQVVGAVMVIVALASVAAVLVLLMVARRRSGSGSPWLAITALGWLAVLAVTYALTTSGASLAEFRYVAVGFPAVAAAVAVALSVTPRSVQCAFAAVAVAAIAVGGTLDIRRDADDGDRLMLETADAIDRLASQGYDRGYSGYWTSSILTYYADAPVLPVVCSDEALTVPYEWLVDMGQFDLALDHPGDRSFIIVDRRAALSLTCPDDLLIAQHGPPVDIVRVRDVIEIWVYDDRDVVVDMTRAWTP